MIDDQNHLPCNQKKNWNKNAEIHDQPSHHWSRQYNFVERSISCELEESEFIAQPWTILGGNISLSSWNIKMICNIIWIYDSLSMFQFERFEERAARH